MLVRTAENVRALCHEMDATEECELGFSLSRSFLGELVGVSLEIRELDHLIALIVVAENCQPGTKLATQLPDPGVALFGRHLEVGAVNAFLTERPHAIGMELLVRSGAF